jgi:hypothetical protein
MQREVLRNAATSRVPTLRTAPHVSGAIDAALAKRVRRSETSSTETASPDLWRVSMLCIRPASSKCDSSERPHDVRAVDPLPLGAGQHVAEGGQVSSMASSDGGEVN